MFLFKLAQFSRVTVSQRFIPEIDGLRFLAIMPVVLLHLTTNYLRVSDFNVAELKDDILFYVLNRGGMGVNIFFAISGFILALPFANHYLNNEKKPGLSKYYWRRLTRLEPPFILSMMLFFCAWLVYGKYSVTELINSLWASLLYMHYFVFGEWSIINPISWSLETEVQFYVLAPIIFLVFTIKRSKYRIGLMVISAVILVGLAKIYRQDIVNWHLAKSILIYIPNFAVGILLADLYVRHKKFFLIKTIVWDMIGVIGLCGIYVFHYNTMWVAPLLQCVGIALVFVAAFKGKWFNVCFKRKEICIIGGMCYSIYLLHYGLLFLIMSFTGKIQVTEVFVVNFFIQVLLVLPIVLAVSAVFFILFEKPFMYNDWYKQFPKKYLSYIRNK